MQMPPTVLTTPGGSTERSLRSVNENIPQTVEEYRTWWREQRPGTPYGYCWCGCGLATSLARKDEKSRLRFKRQPMRYVAGHQCGTPNLTPIGDLTGNYCECGCGQRAGVWRKDNKTLGRIRGESKRFKHGHYAKMRGKEKPDFLKQDCGYETPCWIWQKHTNPNGYGLAKRGRQSRVAHRLYYERHKGPIPTGMQVDHLCNVRPCVNPDHLEAVTPKVNTRRSTLTRLTPERVTAIREEAKGTGQLQKLQIATKYGISESYLYALVGRKRWEDVP